MKTEQKVHAVKINFIIIIFSLTTVIVDGVTLIWQKAVATIHITAMNLYWRYLTYIIRWTDKKLQNQQTKTLPSKLHIQYLIVMPKYPSCQIYTGPFYVGPYQNSD